MEKKISISLIFSFLIILNICAQSHEKPLSWNQALKQDSGWYATSEAIKIADNLLIYQHKSGGWPKNINMAKELSETEKEEILMSKNQPGSALSRATIDNDATCSQLYYLAQVYKESGIERFKQSFIQGVYYLLEAQYDNGGWPQYYPIREGYYEHITFNDDAITNTMRFLQKIILSDDLFASLNLSDEILHNAEIAFEKGIDCILQTQIVIDGNLTVWCAQHDKNTLAPANARSYELKSLSGSESVGLTLLLMSIDHPTKDIIACVEGAVKWFQSSKIEGIKVIEEINEEGKKNKIVVEDKNSFPLWGRFYDIETGKPFFCSRDGVKRNSLSEISYERRNGYRWYTNKPSKALEAYLQWKKKHL